MMNLGKFRAKPIVVSAARVTLENLYDFEASFAVYGVRIRGVSMDLKDRYLEVRRVGYAAEEYARIGDWLVRDSLGQFFVLTDVEFHNTYQEV